MKTRVQSHLWGWGIAILLLSLTSCHKPKPNLAGSGMDLFAPLSMRVHPLSQITRQGSQATLEARMEFTDSEGDVGKAVGTGYFELFAYDVPAPAHKGSRLGLWEFAIDSAKANREHWDNITRTYLFRLSVSDATTFLGSRFVLAGTLVLPNGRRMSDDQDVTVKKP